MTEVQNGLRGMDAPGLFLNEKKIRITAKRKEAASGIPEQKWESVVCMDYIANEWIHILIQALLVVYSH